MGEGTELEEVGAKFRAAVREVGVVLVGMWVLVGVLAKGAQAANPNSPKIASWVRSMAEL